ncbi:alanine:cation symporter family protein [Actinomyces sp. 2119]|uniref:alanine/glycine:cation symporter family protein n=1 Tax=Actinomyces sp. 2119 TaxID=2321393 RepID=UPI000E6CF6A9|nr:alanine/glycine:cation symporter family protein [Actinomyces sp. 2119]RJF42578.1 alanine:cation symporter family protein [Actinomyces sp. 2119]
MSALQSFLTSTSDLLFSTVLVWLLLAVGLYFTVRTRAVQLRHAGSIAGAVAGSRSGAQGGISSFQAFAIGLACRVGTGNIVGVALALAWGGPGAVLWMWLVAVLGTATAFAESTLAQVFKVRRGDGTFRGGPAHYMSLGLGLPVMGGIFAVVFMVANGLAMPMVQANAITASLGAASGLPAWVGALLVTALTAPVLLGGLRAMARVAEYLAPFMALSYLLLVLVILLTHPGEAWEALRSIFAHALGLRPGLAGVAGGIMAAVLNGVRRGLFSNEAGLGGSACAAGSATVSHPVQQGLIQAFGVVVDTLVVCTATALVILVAGRRVDIAGATSDDAAGHLTQDAVAGLVGEWTRWPMAVLVMVLAYTTIIGAFSYAQVCLDYLTRSPLASYCLQVAAVCCGALGAVQPLTTVWTLADVLLGIGAILNLTALALLGRWVVGALRDWEAQRGARIVGPSPGRSEDVPGPAVPTQPEFHADSPYLPAPLTTGAWPLAAQGQGSRSPVVPQAD